MRASVLHGIGDVRLENRQDPIPGPGQVLVRVAAVGVCGSDIHYYEHGQIGSYVIDAPLVLGHEAAGDVAAIGAGVHRVKVGARVSIEPGVPDFTCPECLAGRYHLCPAMSFYATPPHDGAFCELVLTHESFAHRVPDTMDLDTAALLEPVSVAVWACRKAAVTAGDRVLVTGAGPIGLITLQVARAFGATEVTVTDVQPERLTVAAALGATRVVNTRSATLNHTAALEPTVLIECSGHPAALNSGLVSLARAGRAVLVGMGGDTASLPVSRIQERELTLTGTFRYANTWPTAIALVTSGQVDLAPLITGHYPLEHAEAALTASRHTPGALKSIVQPNL
ncbi:MAG: NAD(P)-dependent alcohol dehydrogenase [Actinomycetota bacterium]|nr:NAD(P)-dependent alcohol dehydrogenase [Actinomycetota bacterium]